MLLTSLSFFLFLLLKLQPLSASPDEHQLKTCNEAGFCHRNRYYAARIQKSGRSYYRVDSESVSYSLEDRTLRANIVKTVPRRDIDDIQVVLPFTLTFNEELGGIRFTIDEIRNLSSSSSSSTLFVNQQRYNETSNWTFSQDFKWVGDNVTISSKSASPVFHGLGGSLLNSVFSVFSLFPKEEYLVLDSPSKLIRVEINMDSFKLEIFHRDELVLTVNERHLLNYEHYRTKQSDFQNILPEETGFDMFADSSRFPMRGDTIPMGPESVALDFTFNEFNSLYGLPEHANSLRLVDTSNGAEPYRLFNSDVAEYKINSTSPIYGSIPLLLAIRPSKSVGVLWNNPADTWVDINYFGNSNKNTASSHFMSETGIIDVAVFVSDTFKGLLSHYTALTGRPALPLMAAAGYHQCRWNYNDEADVFNVVSGLDNEDIPFDFIWLDLEYTDERKYFTWNPDTFSDPVRLLKRLAKLGRELVVLIDPHLYYDYAASDLIRANGVAVRSHTNNTFEGKCWPGKSIWIDTFSKLGGSTWGQLLKDFIPKGIKNLNIWNDMNEPSVFGGPETTAPRDLLHAGGFEERAVHNLYGMTVHQSTYEALREIHPDKRPFVLTRSFFAGSQRSAATWTGDNAASWEYLQVSIPMVLTNNIVGMPYIGADVGGFFGNPDIDLLVRWYQTGMWYPFFRAHAHIETLRREPYLFIDPFKSMMRDAIRLRYSLLPVFYTAFHEASVNGSPIMRPMMFEKPDISSIYAVDDQFYLGGSGILVKPVTQKDATEVGIVVTPGIYYDLTTLSSFSVLEEDVDESGVVTRVVDAPLDKIPAFIEGGHVIFRKERYRRSSKLMFNDPYTVIVAPSLGGNGASGKLYVDDGESFKYRAGEFLETEVSLEGSSIRNNIVHSPLLADNATIERVLGNTLIEKIIILIDGNGLQVGDTVTIEVSGSTQTIPVEFNEEKTVATIRNPNIRINDSWEVKL